MEPKAKSKIWGEKRILVAPLDWGLGHAVRCIPLIKQLIEQEYTVLLAVTNSTGPVLKKAFPDCIFLEIPPYKVRYPFRIMELNLLLQAPWIFYTARKEHLWLQRTIQKERISAVISDNRFGLFSKKCPCVFISHQIQIPTPFFLTSRFASRLHQWFIGKFSICWIPDRKGEKALAPSLSQPESVSFPYQHIGWLSDAQHFSSKVKRWNALFILSGPEPLRTILESRIRQQLLDLPGQYLLIRGSTLPPENKWPKNPNLTTIDLASRSEINEAVSQCDILVSRSGYTTLMDLTIWQKPSLLIPTPGQYEQMYLGAYAHKKGYAFCVKQNQLELSKHLEEAKAHARFFPKDHHNESKIALEDALEALADLISDCTYSWHAEVQSFQKPEQLLPPE